MCESRSAERRAPKQIAGRLERRDSPGPLRTSRYRRHPEPPAYDARGPSLPIRQGWLESRALRRKHYGPDGSHAAECDERRAVTGMHDDEAGERGRKCRAYALRGYDHALGHVEPPGAAHDVGYDDRKDRAVDTRADAVKELYAHQPVRVVRDGVKHAADGQHDKTGQKIGPQMYAKAPAVNAAKALPE
jgi:hypothetical protein